MENVLILILFLLIIIAALLVVPTIKREKRIIHEEEHWYYVVFVCEKFTWCQPEVQAEFWHVTADQLATWLNGKYVESITKLD